MALYESRGSVSFVQNNRCFNFIIIFIYFRSLKSGVPDNDDWDAGQMKRVFKKIWNLR